jgi:YVTN family beta-propeller protein
MTGGTRHLCLPKGARTAAWLACATLLLFCAGCHRPQRSPLLAVSRSHGNNITLIQLDAQERELETFPLTCPGAFGVAFTPQRDSLYATCWENSQIVLLDLEGRRISKIFSGAKLPAWIRLRDGTDEMWISSEGAGKVIIYRSGTDTVLGEIATGAGPADIVFTDRGTKAWVSNETSGTVSLLDARQRRKIRDIQVGKVPQGMALTSKGDRLLVTNFGSDTVSVIDVATGREIAQVPVCQGPADVATSVRDRMELAYVSCFIGGAVATLDIDGQRQMQQLAVGDKPLGIVVHPDGGRIYVAAGGSNSLIIIQAGRPNRILRRMKIDGNPLLLALAP